MASLNLLNETFNLYYDKARECHKKGDKLLAKRYYMLAAEQMLKIAKENSGELQKAQLARAKSLVEIADSILVEKPVTQSEVEGESTLVIKNDKISLEEALTKLSKLEGLSRVKRQVLDWIDQIKVFQMRKERSLSVPEMSYHLVFTGNPGTGKTTVARLMAQIYCALGILSEGQLVEVDRGELVAGYVGQTAVKTKEVLKKAYGGVLFIDEAYSLASGGNNDFGREAIDTILKEMEDKRGNLVVIAAGYEKPMEKFIDSNPGLRSRFKNFIQFDDYDSEELFHIFLRFCEDNQYTLSPEASDLLREYFVDLYDNKGENFGNGRDVRNLFERIITRQSKRVAKMSAPTDEDMVTILKEDLPFKPSIKKEEEIKPEIQEEKPVEKPEIKEEKPIIKPENIEENRPENKKDLSPEQKVLDENAADPFDTEFKFDWDSLPIITFNDIAGLNDVKEVVRVKVLLPLQNPEVFEGYVRKSGGGLLLYGPPGTGKTMIAAAIANEIHAKFCSIKPSDLLNQGAGNTEKAVRALFAQARTFPCSVIYFDEMDAISPKSTRSQYAKQLRSEFLAQLQGIEEYGNKKDNILFLIAATNKPWDVDSAFIRPGRFGTRVYVGLPDEEARKYMINRRIKKINEKGIVTISSDLDIDTIVEKTNGYNGADMTNMLDRAEEISALRGISSGEKTLIMDDFTEALNQVTSSVQSADIEKLLEWKSASE